MNNRIKELRKSVSLTQTEFGARIGIKGNTITNYESGLRTPSDAVILSICRTFNVNEKWLRTGEGDMFKPRTRNQEIMAFADLVMEAESDSFKKRFVSALSKFSESDWDKLEEILDKLQKGIRD